MPSVPEECCRLVPCEAKATRVSFGVTSVSMAGSAAISSISWSTGRRSWKNWRSGWSCESAVKASSQNYSNLKRATQFSMPCSSPSL